MKKSSLIVLLISIAIIVLAACYLPTATASVQSKNTEIFFPRAGTDPAPILANLYSKSSLSIDCAIYSLTHPVIVQAMKDAHNKGIRVRVITDKSQAAGKAQTAAINNLVQIGVPVKISTHSGSMHLKMSIVDQRWLTTGSYNYSLAASNSNDEMFVVIDDSVLATGCLLEFNKIWATSELAKMSY